MPNLNAEIIKSVHWRRDNNLPIPNDLLTRAYKAAGDLASINAEYHDAITRSLISYFEGGNSTSTKNQFKKAMVNAFNDAFDLGWVDGGQELPVDDAANGWVGARMTAELGFIDMLFQQAKELKSDAEFDRLPWISERADGYTGTLREVYNQGKLRASKDIMVSFEGDDGVKSCDTCQKLKGSRHRISWYVKRNYVPPHGSGLDCSKGARCKHVLVDDKGNKITV